MGIVVTICMVLILLLSVPTPLKKYLEKAQTALAGLSLLIGVWNIGWYWAQHIGEFWGNMALTSGLLMIFTSLLLLREAFPFLGKFNLVPAIFQHLALIALGLLAAYYSYTIILLNL